MCKDHKECGEIVETIAKMNEANDLAHLAKETEKLYKLCDNYKDFDAMYQRMKSMLDDEIKPARINVRKQLEALKVFIADVKAAMKKAFLDYQKKITTLGKKNGAEIEA